MIQDPDSQFAGNDPSGVNPPPSTQAADLASGMRPETADFLSDLAGIGTGAFLAMRQSDPPEYEDWRDQSFAPDESGNYVSRDGQTYTDDDLERMHGVLSRQAGNPLVSGLFDGPKSPWADYMAWRNQNYRNENEVGGAWEDEDGTLYTEPALQEMFGAKFATQPSGSPDQTEDEKSGPAQQEVSAQNVAAPTLLSQAAGQGTTNDSPGARQPIGKTIAQATTPAVSKPAASPSPQQGNKQNSQNENEDRLERESKQQHPGVEVLTFDPVGHGRSSFGHQAISIDGHVYSFTEKGRWDDKYSTNGYLADNNFRNAKGQVLNLTSEEAAGVLKAIHEDMAVQQKWTANNNCTTKVRDMLEQGTHKPFWIVSRTMNFAPADFSHMLDFLGYVNETRQYPKAK